jgi:hypothetical protein
MCHVIDKHSKRSLPSCWPSATEIDLKACRVCCCDSGKKKTRKIDLELPWEPRAAARRTATKEHGHLVTEQILHIKPVNHNSHWRWSHGIQNERATKKTANNYQGDYFYCWFHCKNHEVMATSSPSNRVPSPLRSSCTFRNHQISYVSAQLWTAATTQPRQKLRLSKTFKLTLASPSKSTFPAPILLLQQTSGKSTRTSASGDS